MKEEDQIKKVLDWILKKVTTVEAYSKERYSGEYYQVDINGNITDNRIDYAETEDKGASRMRRTIISMLKTEIELNEAGYVHKDLM